VIVASNGYGMAVFRLTTPVNTAGNLSLQSIVMPGTAQPSAGCRVTVKKISQTHRTYEQPGLTKAAA
jgi:hypothetical protein